MRIHRWICGAVAICALLSSGIALAQEIIFSTDFESGIEDVRTIRRYTDTPTSETRAPAGMEAAFPPPSGRTALLLAPDRDNSNLGAAVMGPFIDRRDGSQGAVTIEARLYLEPSNRFDQNNAALIAIDDTGAIANSERYHRFGYRAGSIYHQIFDGASFISTTNDTTLGPTLTIPGWHTFAMRFEGTETIRFFVDGRETNFSPVRDASIARVQGGVMVLSASLPLLVDDFQVSRVANSTFDEEIVIDTDVESPATGAFYIIDGNWRASTQSSRAPGIAGNPGSWRLTGGVPGSAAFLPTIPAEAMCEVFATWPREANSTNVTWTVNTAGGSHRTMLDQDGHGGRGRTDADAWASLGTHRFVPGTSPSIIVSSTPQSHAIVTNYPQLISAGAVRLVPAGAAQAEESGVIRWRRSYAAAVEESRTTQRDLIIFAYSDRSRGSRIVMDNVLTDPHVIAAFNDQVPVSIRLDDNPRFTMDHSIGRVPAIIILDRGDAEIARHMGRISIEELLELLEER